MLPSLTRTAGQTIAGKKVSAGRRGLGSGWCRVAGLAFSGEGPTEGGLGGHRTRKEVDSLPGALVSTTVPCSWMLRTDRAGPHRQRAHTESLFYCQNPQSSNKPERDLKDVSGLQKMRRSCQRSA